MYSIVKGSRRYRYIGFQVKIKGKQNAFSESDFIHTLRQQAHEVCSKDAKELGLWLIRFNGTQGIIKCNYQEKEHVMQLLIQLKNVGATPVRITTHACSGTIRGLTS